MAVYDCFQFFNEIDLLLLRMNMLDKYVDYFVVSESTVTFSGKNKPLYFLENKHLFEKFSHKIIHQIVADTPEVNPFLRDRFQKNAVKRPLIDRCSDNDIIIFSDMDELPSPEALCSVLSDCQHDLIYHFAQRYFMSYMNMELVKGWLPSFCGEFDGVHHKQWLGTKACRWSFAKKFDMDILRHPEMKECGIRVPNGGWHFSYMGGDKTASPSDRAKYKIESAAHQEFNNDKTFNNLEKRIAKHREILGRRGVKFDIVPIDESFPLYLREHQEDYAHLIAALPEKRWWQKLCKR